MSDKIRSCATVDGKGSLDTGFIDFAYQPPGLFINWDDCAKLSRYLKESLYYAMPDTPNLDIINNLIETIDEIIW